MSGAAWAQGDPVPERKSGLPGPEHLPLLIGLEDVAWSEDPGPSITLTVPPRTSGDPVSSTVPSAGTYQ
jgi:hypothetical protein